MTSLNLATLFFREIQYICMDMLIHSACTAGLLGQRMLPSVFCLLLQPQPGCTKPLALTVHPQKHGRAGGMGGISCTGPGSSS